MGQNLVGLSPHNKITTISAYLMSQKTSRLLERKITRVLASLPDDRLRDLARTQEQIKFWLAMRRHQEWVAQCLDARFTGKDDPLKPLLKLGGISQLLYDRVWLVVDLYEQMWGLVQLVTPYVQEEFEGTGLEFLAESAYKLFVRLVWNKVNKEYRTCLKYHESSSPKYEKACRLVAKQVKEGLNPVEELKLRDLLEPDRPDMLLQFVLALAEQKATKRRLALKSKLEMFYISLGKLCEKEATISRKVDSYAWKNGRRVKASRYGGTYSEA
jgi:hypothetical protein